MLALALSLVTGVCAQADAAGQVHAVATIRQLGGTVEIGPPPDESVAVGLTGSSDPAACLPGLKDISNLHSLDL